MWNYTQIMGRVLLGLVTSSSILIAQAGLEFRSIATGVVAPSDIQHAGDGTSRLFFVQQNGIIRIYKGGVMVAAPFLDVHSRTRGGGERGLLGLAFPPDYAQKQHFYVNYTDLNGHTVIARYRAGPNADTADPSTEQILLRIEQPYANHNGGQLRFGPDGYLYIGMGDGGSGGDPQNRAQNPRERLGKMLRIDVESAPGTFQIPPSNPFAASATHDPAIWALGLRNPWRFSFDRGTGDLWIADVGQNQYEEINFQPASSRGGENYGWNIMEGMHCFRTGTCSQQGLTLPVAEYGRGDGCSVTGGFVYRGSAFPGLRGTYLYGDYCSGRIWGIRREGSQWTNQLLATTGFRITTFGEDEAGELYVADAAGGAIHRIEGPRAPVFSTESVVNAASFQPGLTPGSLATLFASGIMDSLGIAAASTIPLPRSLNGVSVTVGGVAAPIHALANVDGQEQINFQVPFEIAGRRTAPVVITREGASSLPVDVPVLDVQPGVFSSASGDAIAIHNANNTLVSAAAPLVAGEYIYVYATGLGPVTNIPETGNAAGASSETQSGVEATLGGMPAEVQFAGLAPGFVGVYQINIRVPVGLPPGTAELTVRTGGIGSPPVRVPIQ